MLWLSSLEAVLLLIQHNVVANMLQLVKCNLSTLLYIGSFRTLLYF